MQDKVRPAHVPQSDASSADDQSQIPTRIIPAGSQWLAKISDKTQQQVEANEENFAKLVLTQVASWRYYA